MNGESPREIAIQVLRRRVETSNYIEQLLERELGGHRLSSQDRALCQELAFGMVRWERTLDWLVARKTAGRAQNASIRLLLQLGLYQLFWLQRIPDHAAVHETVELGKRLGFGARAGFLNAILRGYVRERAQTRAELESLKKSDPALGYSHPEWLFDQWQSRWGREKTLQLLEWNNQPPPVFARLNELKSNPEKLEASWSKEGIEFKEHRYDWTKPNSVFELLEHPPLASCESFQDGQFYAQDPSTLLAVENLAPQPGETILDLCAAPGGKTCFIAQLMRNRGKIIAHDVQPSRLKLVEENAQRLGVTCVEIAAELPAALTYDRILIDAPCSNTGVLRRRVDLRWRLRLAEIQRLVKGQGKLLAQAATRLKPGGVLVYSTCSLEPEENEQVVENFLVANPQFKMESKRQLLPFIDHVDGAYAAVLRKQK